MSHITKLLRPGEGAAVHLRDLAAALGCHRREVQRQIRRERLDGAPICSGRAGVYLAESPAELARFIRKERGKAREIEQFCDAMQEQEGGDHAETVQ